MSTHTGVGKTVEETQALLCEHNEFKCSAKVCPLVSSVHIVAHSSENMNCFKIETHCGTNNSIERREKRLIVNHYSHNSHNVA